MDMQNFTALLVALTPFLIAWLRGDGLTDNQVTALTIGVVLIAFFFGRWLDGALVWPLPQAMAAELAAALIGQQALYQLIRKTTPMQALESVHTLPAEEQAQPSQPSPADDPDVDWEQAGKL